MLIFLLFLLNTSVFCEHIYDAVIVGAGLSGIISGNELVNAGITNFKIVEAQSRIGGRIYSYSFDNETYIELGANWIHGYKNNPLFNYIKKFEIGGFVNNDYIVLRLPSVNSNETISVDFTKQFKDEEIKLLEILSDDSAIRNSLDFKYQEETLRNYLTKMKWFSTNDPLKKLVEFFIIDCDMAVPAEKLGASFSEAFSQPYGNYIDSIYFENQYFIFHKKGFKKLPELLLGSYNGYEHLSLNSVVEKIEYNHSDIVYIYLENGDVLKTKHVLITASSSVLNKNNIKFLPSLPKSFTSALKKIDMVIYTKIYILFPCRFWPNYSNILLYDEENTTYFKWLQHIPIMNEEKCVNLTNSYANKKNDHYSILLTTLFDEGVEWFKKQSKEYIIKKIMQILKRTFGKNIPDLAEIYWYDWNSDKHFYGSFPIYKTELTVDEKIIVNKNINRLFFAGDWQNWNYIGSLHGAFFSSFDRTQDIISSIYGYWNFENEKEIIKNIQSCIRRSDNICT